jgi:adenylate cyclase
LAGLIAAGVLALAGVLDPFEARTFDWRARLLAPNDVSNSVRLIMLDKASSTGAPRKNGLSWPWPREVYGVIVDFCRRAEAAAVAFDVLYTEPSSYGVSDDTALAVAGKRYGRLVLPVFLGRETGQATTWPASAPAGHFTIKGLPQWGESKSGLTAPRAAFPVPDVAPAAALLANVSQDPDADGVYRRVGLFSLFDGRTVPTLALGVYALAHPHTRMNLKGSPLRLGETRIPLDSDGRAIPHWRGASAFPAVSAAAVIQSELALREGGQPLIDPAVLKDKIVLFGFSAPGLLDLRPSPVAGVTSGTEIHAQVLESLVRGDFLRETPVGMGWILAALLGLGAGIAATMAANALGSATAMAVFLPLPVLLALAGQAWLGLWLPLALPETAAAAALGVGVLIAYATEGRQKRFIKTAFRQYLSPAVIEQLIAHPERMSLGGELRELTIFFSDLQGFTGISEKLDPKDSRGF